jgi:hypothetical protein
MIVRQSSLAFSEVDSFSLGDWSVKKERQCTPGLDGRAPRGGSMAAETFRRFGRGHSSCLGVCCVLGLELLDAFSDHTLNLGALPQLQRLEAGAINLWKWPV